MQHSRFKHGPRCGSCRKAWLTYLWKGKGFVVVLSLPAKLGSAVLCVCCDCDSDSQPLLLLSGESQLYDSPAPILDILGDLQIV